MKFSVALKRAAKRAGLNELQIALKLGVSASTVNRWFRGDVEPRGRTMLRVVLLFPDIPVLMNSKGDLK